MVVVVASWPQIRRQWARKLCGEASLDAMYPPVFSCRHLSLHTMSQEYSFGRLDVEPRGSRVMWGWGCRSIIISPQKKGRSINTYSRDKMHVFQSK